MNPAGGLAQPVADLAGLALQQIDHARALFDVRGLQTPARGEAAVHAPLGIEPGLVKTRAQALVRQVFRHIEANATRTDQRHGLAHRFLVTQHVEVAQHLGVADALDLWHARCNAGGQHHLLKPGADQGSCIDPFVQLQSHTGALNLLSKVTQRFLELFLARHLLGDIELPANLAGGIEQGHRKAAARGRGGKGKPGRASADHRNAFLGGRRRLDHQRLIAGPRIHQATGDLAAKSVVQTGLVAADAGVDLVRLAGRGLVDKVRVGEKRACHRDHVGHALGQHLLCHFRRVDAVGGHQRNANLALELLRHPRPGGARHFGGDGGDARLVPADAGVQDGHTGSLQFLRQLHHLGQ